MRLDFRREDGSAAGEYGLIAGLVSVLMIGALASLGVALDARFEEIAGWIADI